MLGEGQEYPPGGLQSITGCNHTWRQLRVAHQPNVHAFAKPHPETSSYELLYSQVHAGNIYPS